MLGFLRCISLLNFEQLKNKKESQIDIKLLVRSLVARAERMSLGDEPELQSSCSFTCWLSKFWPAELARSGPQETDFEMDICVQVVTGGSGRHLRNTFN